MKAGFKLSEVKPNIFFLDFKDPYNLAMHFVRFQEYYESPSKKFRCKDFDIFDFMEAYSKKYGNGIFTYPKDWGGFNIPSKVFYNCLIGIKDKNKYDIAMADVYNKISVKTNSFYIIGSVGSEALAHEIAHGLYYTNKQYKKEMLDLVNNLDKSFYNKFTKYLIKIGYTKSVLKDEVQAYLSTGMPDSFQMTQKEKDYIKNIKKKFVNVYKNY